MQLDDEATKMGSWWRQPMPECRRPLGLPPRWLTVRKVAQFRRHFPSWLRPKSSNRRQEIGFPVIGQVENQFTKKWSDQDREQREQGNGPEHRQ
jgi:hypothetical protein